MKPITAFKTQDGKLFESKEQAQDHEFGQMLTDQLDEFSKQEDCPYPDGVANSQMRKSIIAWEKSKLRIDSVFSIDVLQLSVRTVNVLKAENIYTLKALLAYEKKDLLKIPNMGRHSLNEIIEALRRQSLFLSNHLAVTA